MNADPDDRSTVHPAVRLAKADLWDLRARIEALRDRHAGAARVYYDLRTEFGPEVARPARERLDELGRELDDLEQQEADAHQRVRDTRAAVAAAYADDPAAS